MGIFGGLGLCSFSSLILTANDVVPLLFVDQPVRYVPSTVDRLAPSLKHNRVHSGFKRVSPPPPDCSESVIRVSNNITHLGRPKAGYKPRQLLSLPPFPSHPLPGKNVSPDSHTTAISWMKYYFADVAGSVIQSHFNKGLVKMECHYAGKQGQTKPVRIKHNEVMKTGSTIYVPVSVAESKISRRFDTIPSGSLCPNADEIEYLQRLDSALLVLNKPPKVPVKGNMAVHNSMDALAAAALCYDYDEGPKLVHRLDRESSGILLMGRSKESISHLHWLFSDAGKTKSSLKAWNDACEATYQKYWALVIGKAERVMLAYGSGLEASQEAVTEYRVLGPTISGCSWLELRPLTHHKHQIRVHCAEALGTPIVGDYKYGWFVHSRWKQMPRTDFEPTSGEAYKMRRPEGLDVQKGSVLSKVPLLHLHCRELVIPNVAKHLEVQNTLKSKTNCKKLLNLKGDVLRFVASMPSHMKISWNLMSSYLV
ncbi:Pseudouridine synthase, catalytic domain-containing protein [Cynara cardunculus var. scolymus]|uniref:Pseudouridine synthase, catalytic domain-containing protein n=1 Tax=Cynara cardunculus var. scolymus TaxID=59895 RepID=A0A118JX69_CYNCS|nr:Pseudouridine synthase, catalytic domain-containing protein [Cynara cardunculus var. scolymus]